LSALRAHEDWVVAFLAVVVLFQAAIMLLWARRAGAMHRDLTSATADAQVAKDAAALALASDFLLHQDNAPRAPEPPRRAEPAPPLSGQAEPREIYAAPGATRQAASTVAAAPTNDASPADVAPDAATQPAEVGAARGFASPPAPAPPPIAPMVAAAAADDTIRDPRAMAAAAWARLGVPAEATPTAADGEATVDTGTAMDQEWGAWVADAAFEPLGNDAGNPMLADDAATAATVAWISTQDGADEPSSNGSADAVKEAEPAPVTTPQSTGSEVLLVEDDENVVKLYRMLLESRGYTVRHAPDGIVGIDEARRKRPDLILLDVMMPRMNGIMFLQSIREIAEIHDVPVVILSNFKEPRLVERAMALGAVEYMVKAQTRPEALAGAIPHWMRGEKVFAS
jgi:CheY-like chemotaxis protein